MTTSLRSTLDFLLYDWLQAESVIARQRFADHSRETFDAVLDTSERIARTNRKFNRIRASMTCVLGDQTPLSGTV